LLKERGRVKDRTMATTDILIVGGGVIGCSIAFQLAQRRAGRVVLLEK